MADGTKIEWTEATWNPITGCSVHSAGCTNCYAMKLAGTRLQHHWSRIGLTKPSKAGPVWTGEVRFNEEWLLQPIKWKRPRMIFVCAHADLFHKDVPTEWRDRIFDVMEEADQHTYQVLTKRSDVMRAYLSQRWKDREPPKHIWVGVSAENQDAADERIPDLLATPAAVRWLSGEPLLGPIDLTAISLPTCSQKFDALVGMGWGLMPSKYGGGRLYHGASSSIYKKIDWVVVGGESGQGARPMHPDWARSLRNQCADAGVPFFFKQWGEWAPTGSVDIYCHGPKRERQFPRARGISWLSDGRVCMRDFTVAEHAQRMKTGKACCTRAVEVDRSALDAFHATLEATEGPTNPLGYEWMYCIGKKAAGRLFDGVLHDGMPAQ